MVVIENVESNYGGLETLLSLRQLICIYISTGLRLDKMSDWFQTDAEL